MKFLLNHSAVLPFAKSSSGCITGPTGPYIQQLDVMEQTSRLFELRKADSAEASPLESCSDPGKSLLEDRIKRVARRLIKVTRDDWQMSDPSGFQDGALFTQVASGHQRAPTAFLFSKFGDLFTTGRFGDPPFQYSSEELVKLIAVISSDYDFKFAPPDILNRDYDGIFTKYRMGTWFQRFFVDVYWTGSNPHEGKLRWP